MAAIVRRAPLPIEAKASYGFVGAIENPRTVEIGEVPATLVQCAPAYLFRMMNFWISEGDLDALSVAMRARGWLWYRDHFVWGKTPAFSNEERTINYFLFGTGNGLKLFSAKEAEAFIREYWRPVARDEVDFFCGRMASFFVSQSDEPWSGPSVPALIVMGRTDSPALCASSDRSLSQ